MITLGGIDLNNDLVWQNRHAQQPVSMSLKRTLGGAAVVYSGALLAGQAITLAATENYGWLTLAQVRALKALAALPGAVYDLAYDGTLYQVMFDFTSGPAIEMTPLLARETELTDDCFTGQIHLITI